MWAFIQCLMAGRQEGRKDGTCRAESQKKDSNGGEEVGSDNPTRWKVQDPPTPSRRSRPIR